MTKFSLKKKFLFLVLCIAIVCPVVAGIIIMRNNSTINIFKTITDESLPRTRQMGNVLSGFRQLRIEVRSLPVRGNTPKDIELYLKNIVEVKNKLVKDKDDLIAMMSKNADEIRMSQKIESAWKKFDALGTEILALQAKGDEESWNKISDLVREMCPKLAGEFDSSIEEMVEWQKLKAIEQTETAIAESSTTATISLILAGVGIIVSLIVGGVFASSIAKTISNTIQDLSKSALEISGKSDDMAKISTNLSSAASQQATGLQETVTSIDEISAMVSRNSDSAATSSLTSELSTVAAKKGMEKVNNMLESINAIAAGNKEIMDQMQKSNKEISEIVTVIQEIAHKTQVINDIVFQTKLLSFNASVEAARAGDHGKGFAVVAEEVGNLASMSGKAANEITEMLTNSVKRVTEIIDGTKSLMDGLVIKSSQKIEMGTSTANECADALDEILLNVSKVNELLKEISSASKEQTTGIMEVNKAMSELDQTTQQNSAAAHESSSAAISLNSQVERLNEIVSELSIFVMGNDMSSKRTMNTSIVASIKTPMRRERIETKVAVGGGEQVPLKNDPRFEEV